jgi:DNA polymerase-3 subunit alpha
VSIGGGVTGLRLLKTRRGDRMAVFMLEAEDGKVEAVVYPEAFGKFGHLIAADAMVLVRGKYERDEETSKLVVAEITPLEVIRERAVREVEITLSGKGLGKDVMRQVAAVLERHPGDRRVTFVVRVNGAGPPLRVRAATARRIKPTDHFVREVEAVCGAGSVVLK